ncbi:VanZ family protein [Lysinibacillus odysseyi]|uniref:Antibiotic resistance protein VanZ n=1 Tax=Lysinibacillus odysseyi 34hs-1 = NBRC 100172 TaxID=1220589 RepID=A0A0A3ILQ2_9BACI|nr:VanZ family protein [Lysinibacillus odysseyi]KGR83748.1 antibiotic resistance protein VanZ [Lysinibacillus odysseyi 34hs-1 = NBRC 100172]
MSVYFVPINTAFIVFCLAGFLLMIPWLIYSYRKYGYVSLWASLVAFSFIFYMLAALFLVLLPLPNTRNTCALQSPGTVHYMLVPFTFVRDIVDGSSVIWSQPSTYSRLLTQNAFLQAAFNFLLLLPLGVYLRYFFQHRRYWKKALGCGFALSLFYEITQGTGIYGIYNCPYRIFDVDDLLLNSTGALAGFIIAPVILALFPSRRSLMAKGERIQESLIVFPLAQLLAVFIDYLLIKISWNLTVGFFTNSGFIEFVYTTICFFILFFVVPSIWGGKTIGTNILRFKLINEDGGVPSRRSLLKRAFALYLPLAASWSLTILNGTELDMNSTLYPYHVWTTMTIFALLIIMWAVLFIHTMFILFKGGKRNFYFDHVAGLVLRKK